MRNILKFSLLGTLLCTISILSNNGYSSDDPITNNNKNKKEESDEELIRKVENVLYGSHESIQYEKSGNILDLKTKEVVTQEEIDRYNKLMEKKIDEILKNVKPTTTRISKNGVTDESGNKKEQKFTNFEVDNQHNILISGKERKKKKTTNYLIPDFSEKKKYVPKKQQNVVVNENQLSINGDKNKLEEEKKEYEILVAEKLKKAQEKNNKYEKEINMLKNKLKEKDELINKLKMQAEQVNNNNSYDNQLRYHLPTSVVQNWY